MIIALSNNQYFKYIFEKAPINSKHPIKTCQEQSKSSIYHKMSIIPQNYLILAVQKGLVLKIYHGINHKVHQSIIKVQ